MWVASLCEVTSPSVCSNWHACFEYSLGENKVRKEPVICSMPWRGVTPSARGGDCSWHSSPHPGEEGVEGFTVLAIHESLRLTSHNGKPALHVQSVNTAPVCCFVHYKSFVSCVSLSRLRARKSSSSEPWKKELWKKRWERIWHLSYCMVKILVKPILPICLIYLTSKRCTLKH